MAPKHLFVCARKRTGLYKKSKHNVLWNNLEWTARQAKNMKLGLRLMWWISYSKGKYP